MSYTHLPTHSEGYISWKSFIDAQKQEPYYQNIILALREASATGHSIYPASQHIFEAYRATPLENLKVVIIGQDPYHGPNQAHGLAFSVQRGITPPPSLKNIFKEIESDLHLPPPQHGDLSYWAQQGVFLLNTSLTVQAHAAGSHSKLGWQTFTERSLELIHQNKEHVVFLCWGAHAKRCAAFIDRSKHCVLTSAHPSPLSAHQGFFGCRHFSKCNDYLRAHGIREIDWSLPA